MLLLQIICVREIFSTISFATDIVRIVNGNAAISILKPKHNYEMVQIGNENWVLNATRFDKFERK